MKHNHPGEKWLGNTTIVRIYRHRSGDHGVTRAHDSSQQGESLHFHLSQSLSMKIELNNELTAWCTEG